MTASGEEQFIAKYLEPLARGFPGAFGLRDDCAEWVPLPSHGLILKTDPIVEGVHFFAEDAPEDLAWKALAVNVSDLAAKAARPAAYLMALSLPDQPDEAWIRRFAGGLSGAQAAFGCRLIGGDTDQRDGPLSIAITMVGKSPVGQMVKRTGAQVGDVVYVSGELGGASLGLQLRLGEGVIPELANLIGEDAKQAALARYLRPSPRLGLRAALRAYARSAMDVSDGLLKDLDRMCRLEGVGAELELTALPLAPGVSTVRTTDATSAVRLATAGDDYEVLATVAERDSQAFEMTAATGGVPVARIGEIVATKGVRLAGLDAADVAEMTGYDHFDKNSRG